MFKPKQVAPFFSMSPLQLSEILKEIHLVYPLNQTPLGSFLLKEKDLAVIELYLKMNRLFGNKKVTLNHFKEHFESITKKEGIQRPEWIYMIKGKVS